MNLTFSISTTMYLGRSSVARLLADGVSQLPQRFRPTHVDGPDLVRRRLSSSTLDELVSLVPGDYLFEGHAGLDKARMLFECGLFWQKGDREWFESAPGHGFNSCHFSVPAPDDCGEMAECGPLHALWHHLACELRATYGYVYLHDVTRSALPQGEGRCLPRLHWRTWLGPEYSRHLATDSLASSIASVEHLSGGCVLIRRNGNPADMVRRTPLEEQAIHALGRDYFWRPDDSWRKPAFAYSQPALDWSDVLSS